MATRIWLLLLMCVLAMLSTAACSCCAGASYFNPFRVIGPSDLVGTWRADYDKYDFSGRCRYVVTGVETLTLRADGTYQQVYDDGRGYVYTSPWKKWYLESRRGGGILHLEDGWFYSLGIRDAEKLASGRLFWHTDDDGTGHPLDLDSTTGIILHVWPRSQREGEVVLKYPPACGLDLPVIAVELYRVATPAPTPTAVP
jgi:hypothetical protein